MRCALGPYEDSRPASGMGIRGPRLFQANQGDGKMRRFSRKRRGGNREAGERPLDAAHWLERLGESKTLPEIAFEPMADAGVPPSRGQARKNGREGPAPHGCNRIGTKK